MCLSFLSVFVAMLALFLLPGTSVCNSKAFAYDGYEMSQDFLRTYVRNDFTEFMDFFVPPDEVFEKFDDKSVELIVGRVVNVSDALYRCVVPFYVFSSFRPIDCDGEEHSVLRKESGFERTYVILDEEQLEKLKGYVTCYDICYQAGADISVDFQACRVIPTGNEWINAYSFYSSRKIVASFLDHALCYLAKGKAQAWMVYSLSKLYLSEKLKDVLDSEQFVKIISIFKR